MHNFLGFQMVKNFYNLDINKNSYEILPEKFRLLCQYFFMPYI
jgi:hypothetical protein